MHSFGLFALAFAAVLGTSSALVDASKRTTVKKWANAYDERTSEYGGCDPNGCKASLTRDRSWKDESRWSCSEKLEDSRCKITYKFEEPQDIVRIKIKFYKGEERIRTLKLKGSGGFKKTITSSGTSSKYETWDINTDETKWLSMEALYLDESEWISITEVRFMVE